MAKKSSSVSKKSGKSASKTTAKVIKKNKKIVKKVVAKAAKKPVLKAIKKIKSSPKVVVKKAEVKATEAKAKLKISTAPPQKLGAVEPEVIIEEGVASELIPQKAEKASKIKPIRIEKGNAEDEKAKWAELFKKYGKDKAIPYKMSESFPMLSPLQHKVLGWGFILKNDNDRIEVLFETGIRMLISNYKS